MSTPITYRNDALHPLDACEAAIALARRTMTRVCWLTPYGAVDIEPDADLRDAMRGFRALRRGARVH